MCSKTLLLSSFLLIFPSLFHLCFCQGGDDVNRGLDHLLSGIGQITNQQADAVVKDAQCMQKLLPCQPFFNSSIVPPPVCCDPLKEMVEKSPDCLCGFSVDPKLLASIGISKDEIMKLPNNCGFKVDYSKCNNTGTSPPSSASSSQSGGAVIAGDQISNDPKSSTKMITPYGITYFGVPGFVALLTVLVFSAY